MAAHGCDAASQAAGQAAPPGVLVLESAIRPCLIHESQVSVPHRLDGVGYVHVWKRDKARAGTHGLSWHHARAQGGGSRWLAGTRPWQLASALLVLLA